jgi:pimeloyl-ACP methyl ester carboxylesterase
MRHPNLRSFLRRIANPALIIWGSEDRLLPAGQGALWQAAMPDAHLMTVPGAGHLIMQEKPEILMHISDFLTR